REVSVSGQRSAEEPDLRRSLANRARRRSLRTRNNLPLAAYRASLTAVLQDRCMSASEFDERANGKVVVPVWPREDAALHRPDLVAERDLADAEIARDRARRQQRHDRRAKSGFD